MLSTPAWKNSSNSLKILVEPLVKTAVVARVGRVTQHHRAVIIIIISTCWSAGIGRHRRVRLSEIPGGPSSNQLLPTSCWRGDLTNASELLSGIQGDGDPSGMYRRL